MINGDLERSQGHINLSYDNTNILSLTLDHCQGYISPEFHQPHNLFRGIFQ